MEPGRDVLKQGRQESVNGGPRKQDVRKENYTGKVRKFIYR